MSVDSLLCIRINSGKGGDLVVERVRFVYCFVSQVIWWLAVFIISFQVDEISSTLVVMYLEKYSRDIKDETDLNLADKYRDSAILFLSRASSRSRVCKVTFSP